MNEGPFMFGAEHSVSQENAQKWMGLRVDVEGLGGVTALASHG